MQDFPVHWLGAGYYQKYSGGQIRQQIKAVTNAGLDEWLPWNPNVSYSENGLLKKIKRAAMIAALFTYYNLILPLRGM